MLQGLEKMLERGNGSPAFPEMTPLIIGARQHSFQKIICRRQWDVSGNSFAVNLI